MQMYPPQKTLMPPVEPSLEEPKSSLLLGWAVKETRSSVPFSSKQKVFMVEKLNIGKLTGNRVDPYLAAERMRTCGMQFLSGQQISSFFSFDSFNKTRSLVLLIIKLQYMRKAKTT